MNTGSMTQTWDPAGGTGNWTHTTPQPVTPPPTPPKTKRPPRMKGRWRRVLIPGAALLVGIGVGTGIGIASQDPTASQQYKSQAAELATAQQQIADTQGAVQAAQSSASAAVASASSAAAQRKTELDQRQTELDQRSAQLDQREAAVKSREDAVAATEQHIAETSIGEGTWTVGRDVQPGTYTTKEPVQSTCYWEIKKTGTNGDSIGDIISNDIVTGGRPTVTLKQGQDFKNQGCGTFVQQ